MNHHFYNGRVDAAITLAGAQGTIQAVYQGLHAQQQSQQAMLQQMQYMPYYQPPAQAFHYNVYPAGLFSIPYGATYFL